MAAVNAENETSLVVPKLEIEYAELFKTLADLNDMDRKQLFKSLLHMGLKIYIESRSKLIDADHEVLESLDYAVERLFENTVMYCARYKALNDVPEDLRERVLKKNGY